MLSASRISRSGLPAAVVLLALAGCQTAKPSAPARADGSPTAATIGAKGSACPLPVTFEVAESWTPKAVKADPDGVLGDLVKRGPYAVVCEIDAKPAGHIGFLRVWTAAPGAGSARAALDVLLSGEENIKKKTYTELTVGRLAAAEVVYESYNDILEETRRQRAVAVSTPNGVAILQLAGFDSDEDAAMVPALDLAKRTLTPTT